MGISQNCSLVAWPTLASDSCIFRPRIDFLILPFDLVIILFFLITFTGNFIMRAVPLHGLYVCCGCLLVEMLAHWLIWSFDDIVYIII